MKPNFEDALDINSCTIVVNGEEWGYASGVTVDGSRPEDLINVIGGQLRRRRPEEVNWSMDAVTLYDNLATLQLLKNEKFQIVITMNNPDTQAPDWNKTQTLTIFDCRISAESISINDSSTFKLSGRAKEWSVSPGH